MTENGYDSAVALVGMSGRFPGAPDPETLWRNLLTGVPGLREITEAELDAAEVPPKRRADPNYVRVGGPVADLDQFDASAFGFSPREAETMEPQHRLFLECAWEALEAAGYPPVNPGLPVGVFAGCAFPDYMVNNVAHLATEPGGALLFAVGNERDSLTSLVSYKLGLHGPSVTVQTFCSTSLVAVHLACQSLLTYECDVALAGGTFLPLPQPAGYQYEPGGILSPDGEVRSFDAAANGSVMGSGVGTVALKRMVDALADGDVIHAVILGSAVNNDGPERVGYTAPGVDGQARVIQTALDVADVKPETIGYVECHMTGTQLGDSIELAAMTRVFPAHPPAPVVLSSVKPSIGHLDRAAGVAGLIRAAKCLHTQTLPGTLGYQDPNPALAAAGDRFTVLAEARPWPAGPRPRRAGVSSFGLGGTNAHVVLEEAPTRPTRPGRPGPHLLTFSAANPSALDALTSRLRAHLAADRDADLADVAFTLQVSRGHFALRRALVVNDHDDAVAALNDPARHLDGETRHRDPWVRLIGEEDQDWAALAAAVGAVLGADADGDDRDAAVGSLGDGLRRLGVRVLRDTDPPRTGEVTVTVSPGTDAPGWIAATLARLWLAGAAIDWPALHRGEGQRVTLPTYPFQRSRYWVDPRPAPAPADDQDPEQRVDDPTRWTYLPDWSRRPLPAAGLDERLRAAGPWLVFSGDERGEALADRLVRAGAEVVVARPGAEFTDAGDGTCTVRPAVVEDHAALLRSLLVAPRTIVHAFSLGTDEGDGIGHFEAATELGFRSAQALVAALAEDPDAEPAELVLLTGGAVGLTGADLRHPEHAALVALAPSIAQENPALSCRHLDLAGVEDIEPAITAATHVHEGPVVVRDGEAWLRGYTPLPLAAPDSSQPAFRPGDVTLITGGLGDVGLVLARHLASTYGSKLILTARTPLPPREQWATRRDGDDRVARHLRNLLDLEARGAEVIAFGADVADESAMRAVVDAGVAAFGRIDAVVHAAGVQDPAFFGLAHLLDRAACDAHFRAKVHGFHVLQSVLGEHAHDRRITLSSVSTVLGGIALGPYSSANAALDAYAQRARRRGEGRWVTVDWDTWRIDTEQADRYSGQTAQVYDMAPAEGVDIFERALAAADHIGHLVISTGPIGPRLKRWVTGQGSATTETDEERARHPRPPLATPYVEPADGLERAIAEVWAATLALETVGAEDNFFELGGHSLIAIQLAARLRNTVSRSMPVTALVEYPTVRQLAGLLAASEEGGH